MHVHWLQHADHEDLGCIAPWLARHRMQVHSSRLQHGDALPATSDFETLILMGGPMNVDDHTAHPWLAAEKTLIRNAIDQGRRVLGLCLGAQLIAASLGAPVQPNPEPEVGWFEVRLHAGGSAAPLLAGWPQVFEAFHWHADTFAIPSGAENLMSSAACAHQGFALGPRVLGLQFHLEVTAADARRWFAVQTPTAARCVQTPQAVLPRLDAFARSNRLMYALLDRFLA